MRRTFLLVLCLLALSACFESPKPLTDAKQIVRDSALIGLWRCTSKEMEADEFMTATVLAFDDQQLLIDLRHSVEPEVDRYRMYASQIGKQVLWNLQELQDDDSAGSWVFARIQSPSTHTLKLQIVEDSALRGANAEAKLEEVRQRAAEASIFADPISCERQVAAK